MNFGVVFFCGIGVNIIKFFNVSEFLIYLWRNSLVY